MVKAPRRSKIQSVIADNRKMAMFLLVGIVMVALPVIANIGPPSFGGHIVAEPTGLKSVAIKRESLKIDLTPLALGRPVEVQATYSLENNGPAKKLDLLFVSGSELVSDFQVRLDGQTVPSQQMQTSDLPSSWQPPNRTPGIGGSESLEYLAYGRRKVTVLSFAPTLPSGLQSLEVRYLAEAAKHQTRDPTVAWQFAYILSPAREWASFGGLDLTIQWPDAWQIACTPSMKVDGNTMRQSFATLPADAIAITVQSPVKSSYQPLIYAGRIAFVAAGLGGIAACIFLGRRKARLGQGIWLTAFFASLAWMSAMFVAGWFWVLAPSLGVPAFQETLNGYTSFYELISVMFVSVLSLPCGIGICLLAFAIQRRRLQTR